MRLRVLFAAAGLLLLAACGGVNSATQAPTAPASAPALAGVPATAATAVTGAPSPHSQPTAAPSTATSAPTAAPIPTGEPSAAPAPTDTPHDLALLPDPTGSPLPSPTRPAARRATPARLEIDAIDLDRPLVSVGLDGHNVPIVPDHDVGWYNLSGGPGQGENIVLWGHVLRFRKSPNTPAPFERLKDLSPGAQIVLYDTQGTPFRYVVTEQVRVTPDQVSYILPQGKERLTLVSCIGDKVVANSGVVEMSHRLVTIAEPSS